MKNKGVRRFLALMLLVGMLASCEKMIIDEDSGSAISEGANVVLRVSRFEHISFEQETRAKVSDVCSRLNFAVYDADGTRVKQVNQKAGDADFGTVGLTLADGLYKVVALAHSSDGNPTMTNASKIQFTNTMGFSDTFLSCQDLTVGEQRQELDLHLKRITSLFRFIIEDDIPASVKQIRFYYTGGSGAFDADTGYGNVNSKQVVMFDVDGSKKQFDLYTILKDDTGLLTFTISAYDGDGNIIKEVDFENVEMERNMITIYSGSFFSGVTGDTRTMSVSFDVDDSWGGELRHSY